MSIEKNTTNELRNERHSVPVCCSIDTSFRWISFNFVNLVVNNDESSEICPWPNKMKGTLGSRHTRDNLWISGHITSRSREHWISNELSESSALAGVTRCLFGKGLKYFFFRLQKSKGTNYVLGSLHSWLALLDSQYYVVTSGYSRKKNCQYTSKLVHCLHRAFHK